MISVAIFCFIGLVLGVASVAAAVALFRVNQTNKFARRYIIPTVVVFTLVLVPVYVIFAPTGFYTKSLISGEAGSQVEFNRVDKIVNSIREDTKGGFGETKLFVDFTESNLVSSTHLELEVEHTQENSGTGVRESVYFYSVNYEAKNLSLWNRRYVLKEVEIAEEMLKERLKQ